MPLLLEKVPEAQTLLNQKRDVNNLKMKQRRDLPLYCSGKRAYSKRGAKTAANKRYNEDRVLLRLYPCGSHWHLTSKGVSQKPKGDNTLKKDYDMRSRGSRQKK